MQKHDNARKFLEIPLIAFMLKLTILETFYIELGLNYQNEIIFFLWRRCISIVYFFSVQQYSVDLASLDIFTKV